MTSHRGHRGQRATAPAKLGPGKHAAGQQQPGPSPAPAGGSAYDQHGCRAYWGHCGCDLYRGHPGPHVGLHLNAAGTDLVQAPHVCPRDYPHLFGEDVPE